MSIALFAISFLILSCSVRVRYGQKMTLADELERLDRDRDYSEIYGGDAESEDELKRRKVLEAGGEQKIPFELFCWTLHIIGAALAIIGAAVWLNEDQSHTLGDLLKWAVGILMVLWFAWIALSAANMFARLQRDISWLKQVLQGVHSSAVSMRRASIDEYAELNDRIDNLKNE